MQNRFHSFSASLFTLSVFTIGLSAVSAAEADFTPGIVTLPSVELPRITFNESASFESLNEETYVPMQRQKLDQNRGNLTDALSKQQVFTVRDFGYATGANGVNLGGRSLDDTQVSTLGVPLNLPQGGGPDLSFFPSYLWSEAVISPVINQTGFSPQAASGSMEFKLWTRDLVRSEKSNADNSRVTATYDRNVQTYSLGGKTENLAFVAGESLGKKEGPAGALSYYFFRKPGHHLIFHVIGSQQEGKSPASLAFPGPDANKKVWRIIPVLESHQELGDGLVLESTLYGDLHGILYEDPKHGATDTHTEQYGIENALIYGAYTLALSGRYTHFQQSGFGTVIEWPLLGSLSREFFLSREWSLRATAGGTYLTNPGFAYSGKIGAKYEPESKFSYFSELGTQPKMPTITARYYQSPPFYRGNPNLQPERVNYFLVGYDDQRGKLTSTTTLKGEYRTSVQIDRSKTTINAGDAYLLYLKEDILWKALEQFNLHGSTLLTYSKLKDSGFSYPDLPYASQQVGVGFTPNDTFGANANARFIGPSIVSDGRFHDPYTLIDTSVTYAITSGINLTAGLDNIFDNRTQVVVDYPLQGRIFYLSGQARF